MGSIQRQQAWRTGDLAFLAVAVLLHAALLGLPLKAWKSPSAVTPARLTVDLRQLPPPTAVESLPEEEPMASPVAPKPAEPEHAATIEQRRAARVPLEELPDQPQADPGEPKLDPLTARQLQELVRRADLQEKAGDSVRQLGSARSWQPPANWNKHAGAPYLAESDNRFNGMTVPEEIEILDRWLASDGSHNVVVNLPNGDTVCGRAEAYNPMQPLVEHIMMFRPCGGGGKRTFSMPERYHKGQ